jgi:hypothetical protein
MKKSGLRKLQQELTKCGCDIDAEEFRDLIRNVFLEKFPDKTVSAVLRDPERLGLPFCGSVRHRIGNRRIPTPLILGTLENWRQQANLSLRDRSTTS